MTPGSSVIATPGGVRPRLAPGAVAHPAAGHDHAPPAPSTRGRWAWRPYTKPPHVRRLLQTCGGAALTTVLASACSTTPDRMEPTTVAPDRYLLFSCTELLAEGSKLAQQMARVRDRIETDIAYQKRAQAALAPAATWLDLLFGRIGPSPEDEADQARLLGEQAAVSKALALQACTSTDTQVPGPAAPALPSSSSAR